MLFEKHKSTALSTPLIIHEPPDITKCQKRKKLRKRISNLNKSNIKNWKGTGIHKNVRINSSNKLDCNLVSTKKTGSNAISHQTQNSLSQVPFSQNKNLFSVSEKLTNKYVTRSSNKPI